MADRSTTSLRLVSGEDRRDSASNRVTSPENETPISLKTIAPIRRIVALLAVTFLLVGIYAATPVLPQNNQSWANLEAAAQSYADCMRQAGLHPEVMENDQGKPTQVVFTGMHVMYWRDTNGYELLSIYSDGTESSMNVYESMSAEMFNNPNPRPILLVDEVEYTAAFLDCLDRSGYDWGMAYDQPANTTAAVMMARVLVAMQMANEIWADCAERNGWTDVTTTKYAVDIPSDITETQLRTLLRACPTSDLINSYTWLDLHMRYPTQEYSGGDLVNPLIVFRISSLAAAYPPGWMPNAQRQGIIDRSSRLTDILNQAKDPAYPLFYPQFGW